jgi:prevent-host-death family protein
VKSAASVSELKAKLSEYLARGKAGEEIIVIERGRPVARLVPVRAGDAGERDRLLAMVTKKRRVPLLMARGLLSKSTPPV